MDRGKVMRKPHAQIWMDSIRSGISTATSEDYLSGNLAQNKAGFELGKQRNWKVLESGQPRVEGKHAHSRDGHGNKDQTQEQADQEQCRCEQNGRQGADKHKGSG
eukprot:16159587-Heterocapsa_arctica.AAC.1